MEIEVDISSNDSFVKLSWKSGNDWSYRYSIPAVNVKFHSTKIRELLTAMNSELGCDNEADYSHYVTQLRQSGRDLYNTLLPQNGSDQARAARNRIASSLNGLLTVRSDCSVHVPWGFVHDGQPVVIDPTRSVLTKFAGFWLSRFSIVTRFYGGGCCRKSWAIDPDQFAVLYALHEKEFQDVTQSDLIPKNDLPHLSRLLRLDVGHAWNWTKAEEKWSRMKDKDGVLFVLAHSDGVELLLQDRGTDGADMNPDRFQNIFTKSEGDSSATLLILNGCATAIGNETLSYMAATARDGFCGFIGTEAEVTNRDAVLYGTRLLWKLCTECSTLREAFEAMRTDPDLFPRSLSYSCFAHPNFALAAPLRQLIEHHELAA
jgi:hypothetical protein